MAIQKIKKYITENYIWTHPLVSAILMALAFPPYGLWPISFIALVPYFLALSKTKTVKKAVQTSFLMGMFLVFTGFYWVSDVAVNFGGLPWIVGKIVLIAFSLFGEMQFLPFGLAIFYHLKHSHKQSRVHKIITYALFYITFDYLYPKIFPNSIGHGLYGWFSFAQLAEITGVPGLTFLMVATNVSIYFLFVDYLNQKLRLKSYKYSIGIFVLMIAISLWGRDRINTLENLNNKFSKNIKVSIIQANIGDVEKLASENGIKSAVDKVLQKYEDFSKQTVNRFKPDLIIWPETAYPLLYTHLQNENANRSGSARDRYILDLVKQLNTPLIFGGYSSDYKKDYNTIFYVTPDGKLKGQYRKNILLAFGEYVPLGPLGPLVQSIIPTIADFGRGSGPMSFEYTNAKGEMFSFSPQICYEGIDTEFTRGCALKEVDFILNVTNDSWFGDSAEPYIHFMITAFRSIEHRIPMVRATNTGFSSIIESTGKMNQTSQLFTEQVIEAEIKIPHSKERISKTIYSIWGEWFAKLCCLIVLVLISRLVYVTRKKIPHK